MATVTIDQLVSVPDTDLELTVRAGRDGLDRGLTACRVEKAGLALTGYADELERDALIVLGVTEIGYFASLDEAQRGPGVRALMSAEPACIVVTAGLAPPEELVESCEQRRVPLLSTPLATGELVSRVCSYLGEKLAPAASLHGVLLDVLGVGVLLLGKSGIGKSALIARFTAGLADSDAVILDGRCNEHELVPFKAFDGVVDALARHMRRLSEVEVNTLVPRNASLLPRVFPVLGRVGAIANAPGLRWAIEDPVQVRSLVFVALRELLFRLAERSSLVVVIDDFQWVDTDSMMLLSQLLQPPDAPPLLLLASWRTTVSQVSDLPEAATRALASGGDLRFLALGSLASRDARELARSIIARVGAAQGADPGEIAREARGHPLYIDAIVRYAATGKRGDAPLQLDEAIWARVLRLQRPARRLMEFVAVSGEPVSRDTLRHAAKKTGAELDKLLSVLRAEHLVRTIGQDGSSVVEAYHDRAREAVLAHLSADTLARLHGRLAVSLTVTSSEEPQAMVGHWLGAGDRARAGLCAVRAGKRAERAMAYGRAADHYELALELLQLDTDRRRELLTRLGNARAGAGRLNAAAEAYLAAAADAPRDASLELRRHATEQYLRAGRLEEGRILCEQLLAEIGLELPRSSARAIASIIWSRVKLRVGGRRFRAKPPGQVSRDDLRFMKVCWSVMSSLNIAAPLLAGAVQQWYVLRALRAGDPDHAAHAASAEAGFLATGGVGRRAVCAKRMLEARELVEAAGTPRARGFHAIMRAMVSFMLGDFESCAAAGEESYRIYTNDVVSARYEAGQACNWWLAGLLYCGRVRTLADSLGVLLREAEMLGDEYLLSSLRSWRGNFVWLARNQPDEARRQAARCTNRPSASGEFHTYHYYRWHTDAQIALYEGDADAARELLDRWWHPFDGSLVHRVQSVRIEINFLRARCAIAAAEQRNGDAEILAEASRIVRAVDKEGASWGRGLAALAGAGVAMQQGDRAAALERLEHAEARSADCHMRLFEQLARLRRGQLMGGSEGEALVDSAEEWMRAEAIVAPEAMAALYTPGFGHP